MYYLTTINPDGTASTTESEAPPALETMQGAVEGFIELVPGFETYGREPCVAFCNETGKLDGLEMNPSATYCWLACLVSDGPFRPDVLHGSVLVISADTKEELSKL